jgi:hypothetical protein
LNTWLLPAEVVEELVTHLTRPAVVVVLEDIAHQ